MTNVSNQSNHPFFMVGCVRSGTTLLRDILRMHPRLECPEETHYFRWADPLGSPGFNRIIRQSDLLRKHRSMDEVDNRHFQVAYQMSLNRRKLADWYGEAFLRQKGNPDGRWFDKTPQNVYGLLLLSGMYPDAIFIHIHRNPLNVVASLKEGKVMPVHSIIGAVNYWYEAMVIIDQYKKMAPERLYELPYEALVEDPESAVRDLMVFLGEDPDQLDYQDIDTYPERNKYRTILDEQEIEQVLSWTEPYRSMYGYA